MHSTASGSPSRTAKGPFRSFFGARLLALGAVEFRSQRGGKRIFDDECICTFRFRRLDHYGRSSQTSSNSDIASGVEDRAAALDVVQRETGRAKAHVFGESSGAIRAGAFAQQAPDRVERLILTAFTYKGEGAAEIARRRARIEELRANPKRKRDAAMIRSIFSRDGHPNLYEPAMAVVVLL